MSTAAVDYVRAGLALVPIPRGQKGPNTAGWQTEAAAIRTETEAAKLNGCNLGIAHRWCGTCAVDIDDFDQAEQWFRERGIDLPALIVADDAVQIRSGRPNRAKVLYRLPPGVEWLPTLKPEDSGTELRCATRDGKATVQDVIPPSVHPETGKPYSWAGDPGAIPTLPGALLRLWREQSEPRVVSDPSPRVIGSVIEGQRNNSLTSLAGTMRRRGMSEDAIRAALLAENASQCKPPLPEAEVHAIAHSVASYAPDLKAEEPARAVITITPITASELDNARLTPRVIVPNLLYADVRTRISAGGTGKTTVMLHEAATLALGRNLWGRTPAHPVRTLLVTREDARELLVGRLREITQAMQLGREDIHRVIANVHILDLSGDSFRLSGIFADLVAPNLASISALIDAVAEWRPDWCVFDPLVSFGVGEARVNDAEQGLIEAFRIIRNRLDCCVEGIHHSGKVNAREKSLDQYTGRGGSALADGCRMVAVMQPLDAAEWLKATGSRLADNESGIVMALPKLSYAKPQPQIYIRRQGYEFRQEQVIQTTPEQDLHQRANQLFQFLDSEYRLGRRYSASDLDQATSRLGMTRNEVRCAALELKVSGRVVYHIMNGRSGSHYEPATLAATDGEAMPKLAPRAA